jgi:hypothetical protein
MTGIRNNQSVVENIRALKCSKQLKALLQRNLLVGATVNQQRLVVVLHMSYEAGCGDTSVTLVNGWISWYAELTFDRNVERHVQVVSGGVDPRDFGGATRFCGSAGCRSD